jgi:Kdo2-lipid IVA lauroyltransferase/acyltransferase
LNLSQPTGIPLLYFFLRPKYWLSLIFIGLCWLIANLPLKLQLLLSRALGRTLYKLAKRRKNIASINLSLCFPNNTVHQHQQLLKENIRQTALGIIETLACWLSALRSRQQYSTLKGAEYLEHAQLKGKGVILLVFHQTSMELAGSLLPNYITFTAMYKPNRNKLIEYIMCRARQKRNTKLIKQSDIRSTLKALKNNEIVWYSIDQNLGNKTKIFAPFFDIQTSTITAVTKLAKITGAEVVPLTHKRTNGDKGVELELHPAFDNFPGANPIADATKINAFLEGYLKKNPANYLWIHQRFRSRPPGEPAIYPQA